MMYGCIESKLDGSEYKYDGMIGKPSLPKRYSYAKLLPSVLDQGERPICVPCSISAFVNWEINVKNSVALKDNKVDLDEIFDRRRYKGDDGMELKDALSSLRHIGVNTKDGRFKISRYAMVGSKEYLKQALIANGVCVGALPVYNAERDDFWRDEGGKYNGGHAVAIVGYNEDGFIIRNSWGKLYGENGYVVLPYNDINKFTEIWTMWT